MKRAALTALVLSALLLGNNSSAQVPPILRAGTHPMWASFGMGGGIGIKTLTSQFKISQEFGYHFSGNASGPAIAINLSESFGDGYVVFEIGPKFCWDIALNPNLGVYLSPFGQLGFAHASGVSAFNMQFGIAGKMILGDRGYVFFQPLAFDLGINGDGVGARYDLMFGGGAIF